MRYGRIDMPAHSMAIPVHHEQSETIEEGGRFQNVYGHATRKAGQPIPLRYAFEKPYYDNDQEAVGSAIVRSELEGINGNEHSPIRQRMETMRQGSVYDSKPYMAPRQHRGSPLRRRFNQMRDALRPQPDPGMGMPLVGR